MMTEKFSIAEKQLLEEKLKSYGAKKDCADKTGIHRCTISRILKTGEATTPIISKLRIFIKASASRVFVETAA